MSLFGRKTGFTGGSFTAPSYDPYGIYKNSMAGDFGFRADKHVVIPGVTAFESLKLRRIKSYVQDKTNKECTLSQSLINDIYSIFVNADVKKRPKNKTNAIRHKVVDKVYDSLTKVVTTDSPLFSNILTRELALALQKVDDEIREEQKQRGEEPTGLEGEGNEGGEMGKGEEGKGQGQSGNKEGQEEGEGDGQPQDNSSNQGASKGSESSSVRRDQYEESVNKALEKATKDISQAKEQADKKIKDLEQQLSKDALNELSDGNPEFLDEVDNLRKILKGLNFNKNSIRTVLDKILNESQNYFSTKHSVVEENLFECEECEDLFGLEFLNPIFKNAEILNMGNNTRKYKGKFDLFLDCSGSMTSDETFEGRSIKMINLAKGIAMTLKKMGLIENLYFFDTQIYEISNVNDISILAFSRSGGTDFNKVMDVIRENKNNSVIVTDGFDSCHTYDKRAFWIGIGGTQFEGYGNDAFEQFRANRQCVSYNPSNSKFEYCRND